MSHSDSDARMEFVGALGEEFVERFRQGERPSLKEYKDNYPQYAEDIEELFPALVMMEDLAPQDRESLGLAQDAQTGIAPEVKKIGDYRIIRLVGRGGMGVVYEAEQVSLGRHVALKVLPLEALPNEKHILRFEREAKAAAKLHHTNIVPVFGVGEDEGLHYYVMQFIQGLGLDEVLGELTRMKENSLESEPATVIPASRPQDVSAADVARSLMTGGFQQTIIGDDAMMKEAAQGALGSTVGYPREEELPNVPGPLSDATLKDTSATRISDTMSLSGSLSLPGHSQSEILKKKQQRKFTYWQSVANMGVQVASALQYAHDQGIQHRDIKPSNLLLDLRGTVWITDFGLAKTEDQQNITHTGDILGTLRYMPPEAFSAKTDHRSDIYSLGLTLYEMLAMKPAFDERDKHRLIHQVTNEVPPRLDKLNPEIPRDLVTVIHKAIERDPKDRYQSGQEFAEDLHRFIDDEPIKARRISLIERFTRWSRRNKGLAAALTTIAGLILVGFIGSTVAAGYFRQLKTVAEGDRDRAIIAEQKADDARKAADTDKQKALERKAEADAAKEETRRSLYFAHIHMAQAAIAEGDYDRLRELLDQWRDDDPTTDLRSFEWYYLLSQNQRDHRVLRGHVNPIYAVAWHPNGRWVASGSRHDNGTIRIWDAQTGQLLQTLTPGGGTWELAWSPDGTQLASAHGSGSVKTWDAETGQELTNFDGHTTVAFDVAWSRDGSKLASTGWDRTVRIWNAEDGAQLAVLPHDARMWCVAWHPDGRRLATGPFDSPTIRIWDTETKQVLESFEGHLSRVTSLEWDRAGERLASGGGDGEIFIWEPGTSRPTRKLALHDTAHWVNFVAWNPIDENLLMTGSGDRTIRLWDAETGTNIETLLGHTGYATAGSWKPDGRQFASGGADNTVRVWNVNRAEDELKPDGDGKPIAAIAWNSDGSLYATGSQGASIRIWQSSDNKLLHTLTDPDEATPIDYTRDLAFSPDGKRIAAGGQDGFVRVWEVETERLLHRFSKHGPNRGDNRYQGAKSVAWHPGGVLLASGGEDKGIRIWNTASGQLEVPPLPTKNGSTYAVAFSPDGQYLVSGHFRNRPIGIWDTASWTQVGSLDAGDAFVRSLQFSPDGTRLAAGGGHNRNQDDPLSQSVGQILIWDWQAALEQSDRPPLIEIDRHANEAVNLSWTPDGKRLASTSVDGTMRLWDVTATGKIGIDRELLRFDSPNDRGSGLRFSPDGSRLAITKGNTVAFHDAYDGYSRERSPQLLNSLNQRIAARTASAEDYRLLAEIDAQQGQWDAAADAYTQFSKLSGETRWILAGVWAGGRFDGGLQQPFPPEQNAQGDGFQPNAPIGGVASKNRGERWQLVDSDPGAPVDFSVLFGQRDDVTSYAVYRVYAPVEQRVAVLFGADDQHRLWANGRLLSEDSSPQIITPDRYVAPVTLQAGWNTLLAKIVNRTGRYGLQLRISDDPVELAAAFERTGQFEEALGTWELAIQSHPNDKQLLLKRAATRWKQGDAEGADADFAKFIAGEEDDPLALERRARSYLALGRRAEGLADYRRAVQVGPDRFGLRLRCANQAMLWNAPQLAGEQFDYLIEYDPDDHWNTFRRAPLYLINGDEAGFRDFRRKFLERWQDTDNPAFADRTAMACLMIPADDEAQLAACVRLGDIAAAAEEHKLYWFFMVADGMAQYRRGEFLASQGNPDAAHPHLEHAQKSLEAALNGLPNTDGAKYKRAQARFILALTLFRLQKETTARNLLEETNRDYRAFKTEDVNGMNDLYMTRLLRGEAFRVILGPSYEKLQQAERLLSGGETDAAREAFIDALSMSKPSQFLLDEARAIVQPHDGGGTVWVDALTALIDKSPDSLNLVRERAAQHVRNEDYLAAGRDHHRFAPLIDEEERSLHWLNTASLLALSGDDDAYRKYCEPLTQEFGNTNNWFEASRLAKVCLLLPGVIEPDRLPIQTIVRKLKSGTAIKGWSAWANGSRALAAFRGGDLPQADTLAATALRQAETTNNEFNQRGVRTLVNPLRAMILIRQGGDLARAKQLLAATKAALDEEIDRHPDGTVVGSSLLNDKDSVRHNAIIGEVLYREAEKLIRTREIPERPELSN